MTRLLCSFVVASVVFGGVAVRAGNPVADVVFEDGQTHVIDAANSFPDNRVLVRDGEDEADTHLSLQPGGVIGFGIRAEQNSGVNITGGSWGGSLVAAGDAEASISGGALDGSIFAADTAIIRILGYRFSLPLGEIESQDVVVTGILEDETAFSVSSLRDAEARVILVSGTAVIANGIASVIDAANDYYDASVVVHDGPGDAQTTLTIVDGGSVGFQLYVLDDSAVTIEGGSVRTILADETAEVAIHGGAILSGASAIGASLGVIDGGDVANVVATSGTATLRLVGPDFNRAYGPIADEDGTITGTLADDSPISVSFARFPTSTIELPEPGAASLACAVLASLTALRRRAAR